MGERGDPDQNTARLAGITRVGTVSVIGTGFRVPSALAFDATGTLYIADTAEGVVYRAERTVFAPARIRAATNALDFGSVPALTVRTASLRIWNDGETTLSITSAACTNAAFALAGPALPLGVPGGRSADLTFLFQPDRLGLQRCTVCIGSNDTNSPVPTVTLSGTGAGTKAPTAVPEGLLAWWPLDDNDREFVSGAASALGGGPGYAAGMVRQALAFDGVDDTLAAPAATVSNLAALGDSFAFETWLRLDDNDIRPILQYELRNTIDLAAVNLVAQRQTEDPPTAPANLFASVWIPGESVRYVNALRCLTLGVWHHVALVVDGTNAVARLLLNGDEVASTPNTRLIAGTPLALRLGHSGPSVVGAYPNRRFKGMLDEPSIYGRALSDAQIRAVILAQGQGKERRPRLGVQPSGALGLSLLLESPYAAFRLESTANLLSPTSWLPETVILQRAASGGWEIAITPSNQLRFYRLIQP